MTTPAAARPASLVVLALALAACTKSEPLQASSNATATATTTAPAPSAAPAPPATPPPVAQAPQPQAPGVGPARPTRATPDPEEGRNQLDLSEPRPIVVGTVPVQAWVADTEERRRLGLMHVLELPKDHGMVFVYPRARRMAFWMHNTRIPLSIAYISEDGTIAQIEDMEAMDESTHPSTSTVRFALEMPKGWYAEHGIKPGVHVDGIVTLEGYGE